MIKAVFLDWSNTLAYYAASREVKQSYALNELGFNVAPEQIAPGLARADRYLFEQTSIKRISHRSPEEQKAVRTHYQQIVLEAAGVLIPPDSEQFQKLISRLNELYRQLEWVLYDDVVPALTQLKELGLKTALVTNMDADMRAICRKLGILDYLDCIVTSVEVGSSKPRPLIFMKALECVDVTAPEAIHIGDQPDIDVAGAIAAGIQPVLLDRDGSFAVFTACRRITSLSEAEGLLSGKN